MENYDFSGKIIVLFASSDGGGYRKTVENLKGSVVASMVIKERKLLNGRSSKDELAAWVNSFKL